MSKITYIDETTIKNQRVLLRADFDVSLKEDLTIADDARISRNVPTLKHLLKNKNKVICVAKLNRPQKRDPKHSLSIVIKRLREYLPGVKITLVDDFENPSSQIFEKQKGGEILVLENIRFYKGEQKNDPEFARSLAALADCYVNDSFAISHRAEASVVGVPQYLPSYGGLLLKQETEIISHVVKKPKKPFVVILGGMKMSTKIHLISKLMMLADQLIIGGGMANTFLHAAGYDIGKSKILYEELDRARRILHKARRQKIELVLPEDVVIGKPDNEENGIVKKIENVTSDDDQILDIGPETQAKYGAVIARAKTILWNGPVGYFENPAFRRGTDYVYYALTNNTDATTIVGGGDTLAAISKKEYLDKITHISTGGGAMLEFIERETLPGLEALKR